MTSNTSEDPPLLLGEGTEVSAKFKGAFCEAKIKKVDRIVKCKITLKNSNESLTVNDSQILSSLGQKIPINDLKQGQLVYISKSDSNTSPIRNLQQVTLNRIIDQSVYTVVFNDGDEKCLKRSFIRFKGEKHYLDSETLNNAPLNNPEHFLYPIKSQNKQSPNSSVNEKKNSDESETESVSNTTCTSLSVKHKKEQDREDEEEDDDDSSQSSSDDYPPEEKDLFVAQLYKFMDDRGTPMNKVPSINKIDIDLHKFFIVVKKYGGYNKVNKQRNWCDVYKRIGLPNPSSANVINLKCSYKRYLHPYEELHRKLGGSMLCSTSSKRSISSESKRLYNARYLTPTQKTKTPKIPKKTETPEVQETEIDPHNDSIQEKEFTIESIANSIQDDQAQQSHEELTLFSMVRNLTENFKKAKKEKEKETKSLKRQSNSKTKIRRTSVDKASEQSKKSDDDYDEDEDDEEEEEDDDEDKPKRKKKLIDLSEESNSTSSRVSKRKSSTSESDKKPIDLPSHDTDGKKIYRACDIEINKIAEVRYGSGKTTYHAKIVQIDELNQTMLVHYLGWNNRYDEWIKISQILKIFSDDYGAYKRRKPTKPNDPPPTNSKKSGKRSSLSSISSSSSGEVKKEPVEVKIKEVKKPVKMRSSDSSSSVSSGEVNKTPSSDSNGFEKDQKSMELELEKIKNSNPETLLSIKEEIMDFEQTEVVPEEPEEEKLEFIQSITNEIIDNCMSQIVEPEPVEVKEEEKPESPKVEVTHKEEEKPVLVETSVNTVQTLIEIKPVKEKENVCKQDLNLPKFPYHLIGCKLVGKQRIRFIEEQMRLCREEYAKLKNEMAAIDRKKKKLKRNFLEKSASNSNTNDVESKK